MSACANCGEPSQAAARYCPFCGAPLSNLVAPPARARKVVTVLFSDVSGFTALGERLDPESLHQVIGRWFEDADAVIQRHGGTVDKHIGDAVMAVFGVPVAHEDDAVRAARAALEMRATLDGLNDELVRRWDVRLRVRTGINTGEVVVGDDAGGGESIIGDAVNVAQRLEAAADPGQVLIGEQTARLLRGVARLDRPTDLKLKGKAAPVSARRLIAVGSALAEDQPRAWTPFVGRGPELERLRRAFDDVRTLGAPGMVTVLGPAGIGKSRLARALLDAVGDAATTVVGRCLPYGESITYWPLAEIARQLPPNAGGEQLAALAAGGNTSVEETQRAVRRALEACARDRPLVMVVEDIHWAAPTMLDLIEYVADFADGAATAARLPGAPRAARGAAGLERRRRRERVGRTARAALDRRGERPAGRARRRRADRGRARATAHDRRGQSLLPPADGRQPRGNAGGADRRLADDSGRAYRPHRSPRPRRARDRRARIDRGAHLSPLCARRPAPRRVRRPPRR